MRPNFPITNTDKKQRGNVWIILKRIEMCLVALNFTSKDGFITFHYFDAIKKIILTCA